MRYRGLALSLGSLLLGCSLDAGVPPATEAPTLSERLANGEVLFVDTENTTLQVTGRYIPQGGVVGTATLPFAEGTLDVRIDEQGDLVIEAFDAQLDDVVVTPAGQPIHLTQLQISLAEPATGSSCWTGDLGRASVETEMTVLLDWALLTDDGGVTTPLGTQEIGPLPVSLEVSTEGGHVIAHLNVQRAGVFWAWAGLVQLQDLELDVRASDVWRGPVP